MRKLFTTLIIVLFSTGMAFSQYYYIPHIDAGQNPGGLNTDDEYPNGSGLPAGWTSILGPSVSTPTWSSNQTIPFTFNFNGNPETQYKVSSTGVLTFTTSATSVPTLSNASLPDASIPDKSVMVWGIDGSGPNDEIMTKTFGTSPNRQHWIFFTSYTLGGTWSYWSIVLEEGSDNIYVVDQRHGGSVSGVTVGVQVDGATAAEVSGSPNISAQATSDPSPNDNTYYEFIQGTQPSYDMGVTAESMDEFLIHNQAPFTISGTVDNYGTQTVNSLDLNYRVNGGAVVTDNITSLSVGTYSSYNFSSPTGWNPATTGTYNIDVWASNINGNADQYNDNDTLSFTVEVVDTFVTRNTCLEVFTSSTCGPCAPANDHMETNVMPNISNYTVVKYQQNFPGSGDPYYTTESVNRRGYYAINSIPRMEIDGQWDENAGNFSVSVFNSYQQEPSFLEITIDSASYTNDDVHVEATINPLINITGGTYRYHVVVTEKKTTQNTGTNGETEFINVMMDMIPNETGNAIASLTSGSPINVSKNTNLSNSNVEEMSDLRVVVFVQDNNTKEILQSEWAGIQNTSTSIAENNISAIKKLHPNPATNNAVISYDLKEAVNVQLKVRNLIGEEVVNINEGTQSVGQYRKTFDVSQLPSGVYLVSLHTGDRVHTEKLIISK